MADEIGLKTKSFEAIDSFRFLRFGQLTTIMLIGIALLVAEAGLMGSYLKVMIGVVAFASIAFAKIKANSGNFKIASRFLIWVNMVAVIIVAGLHDGIGDVTIFGFVIPICIAGIVGNRKQFIAVISVIVVSIFGMFLAQHIGIYNFTQTPSNIYKAIAISIFFIVIAGILWQTSLDVHSAFKIKTFEIENLNSKQKKGKNSYFETVENTRSIFLDHASLASMTGKGMVLMKGKINKKRKINPINMLLAEEVYESIYLDIKKSIRANDILCLISLEEFLILLVNFEGVDNVDAISTLASEILKDLNQPKEIGAFSFEVACNIGISKFNGLDNTFDICLRQANIAAMVSEVESVNGFRIFSDEMENGLVDEISQMRRLADAIGTNDLMIFYQPIIDIDSGGIYGCEALIRWNDQGRLLKPEKFFERLSSVGLSKKIDRFVFESVCKQIMEWDKQGIENLHTIFVNMSCENFENDGFESIGIGILEKYGISPSRVGFEIRTRDLAEDFSRFRGSLSKLAAIGHPIVIDDCGAGGSNVDLVSNLRIFGVNVNREVVKGMNTVHSSPEIVRTLTRIGEIRNAKVRAVGVETKAIAEKSLELGCQLGQGIYWSDALPANQYIDYLKSKSRNE